MNQAEARLVDADQLTREWAEIAIREKRLVVEVEQMLADEKDARRQVEQRLEAQLAAAEDKGRSEERERLLGDEALFAVACKRVGIAHDEKANGNFDAEQHARELVEAALDSEVEEQEEPPLTDADIADGLARGILSVEGDGGDEKAEYRVVSDLGNRLEVIKAQLEFAQAESCRDLNKNDEAFTNVRIQKRVISEWEAA